PDGQFFSPAHWLPSSTFPCLEDRAAKMLFPLALVKPRRAWPRTRRAIREALDPARVALRPKVPLVPGRSPVVPAILPPFPRAQAGRRFQSPGPANWLPGDVRPLDARVRLPR